MLFSKPMFAESYGFGEWDTLGYDAALDTAYPFSESYGYGEWGTPVSEPYLNLPDYTWMRDWDKVLMKWEEFIWEYMTGY